MNRKRRLHGRKDDSGQQRPLKSSRRSWDQVFEKFVHTIRYRSIGELETLFRAYRGIDIVNYRDRGGNTLLDIAMQSYAYPRDAVRLLLKQPGIDVNHQNHRDARGWTALIWTSSQSCERFGDDDDVTIRDRIATVSLLLGNPQTDVNLQDHDGETALMCASIFGHDDAIQLLLRHPKIDANIQDYNGETALMHASTAGHNDTLELLLHRPDIDVNLRDRAGRTALMHASLFGEVDAVRHLLQDPRVDIHLRDDEGHTAWDVPPYFSEFKPEIHRMLDDRRKVDIQKMVGALAEVRWLTVPTELCHLIALFLF